MELLLEMFKKLGIMESAYNEWHDKTAAEGTMANFESLFAK